MLVYTLQLIQLYHVWKNECLYQDIFSCIMMMVWSALFLYLIDAWLSSRYPKKIVCEEVVLFSLVSFHHCDSHIFVSTYCYRAELWMQCATWLVASTVVHFHKFVCSQGGGPGGVIRVHVCHIPTFPLQGLHHASWRSVPLDCADLLVDCHCLPHICFPKISLLTHAFLKYSSFPMNNIANMFCTRTQQHKNQ